MQGYKCASMQVCKYASMQVYKYEGIKICNDAIRQVGRSVNFQVCIHKSFVTFFVFVRGILFLDILKAYSCGFDLSRDLAKLSQSPSPPHLDKY